MVMIASTFSFGLAALMLVWLIAALQGRENTLVLILSGIIMSGFFAALVSLMQYMADTEETLPNIVFWLLGSFATANWHKVLMLALPSASSPRTAATALAHQPAGAGRKGRAGPWCPAQNVAPQRAGLLRPVGFFTSGGQRQHCLGWAGDSASGKAAGRRRSPSPAARRVLGWRKFYDCGG
jgi:hypothetical protein